MICPECRGTMSQPNSYLHICDVCGGEFRKKVENAKKRKKISNNRMSEITKCIIAGAITFLVLVTLYTNLLGSPPTDTFRAEENTTKLEQL